MHACIHTFTVIRGHLLHKAGFPDDSGVKNPPAMKETQVQSLGWEDLLEKGMATHFSILAFLSGKYHGQRNLVGYSPWGRKRVRLSD